jgi:hypothetical protein
MDRLQAQCLGILTKHLNPATHLFPIGVANPIVSSDSRPNRCQV